MKIPIQTDTSKQATITVATLDTAITPIPGYEHLYGVTRRGNVWAYPKSWVGAQGCTRSHNGLWLGPGKNSGGYLGVYLAAPGRLKRYFGIHRLVALTYLPNPAQLPQVNHKNGVKTDNAVENLEWCTHSQNIRHAVRTGLFTVRRGSRHHSAKLTEEDVRDIRMFARAGISRRDLARVYPVARQTIDRIIVRQIWREVQP